MAPLTTEDLLEMRAENNAAILSSLRGGPWQHDLMDIAFKDAEMGFNSTPYPCDLRAAQTFTLCRSMPVREEKSSGWRTRAVDDEKEAGINPATVLDHATCYDTIMVLVLMVKYIFRRGFCPRM